MSKAIKISDEAYNKIVALMLPRETFPEAIDRLIRVYEAVNNMRDTLGPAHPVVAGSRREE